MTDETKPRRRHDGLAELAEDAVGFGGQELRLTRDLALRPGKVMDAYDAHGPMAGGLYPKPLRYYLTIMGLYLVVIAILGGFEGQMSGPQFDQLLGGWMRDSGKSPGEFRADMDQWYSLASVPVTAIFFGGAAFLLIRRWSPAGDRQDFNQTFTFINGYSVLGIPFGLIGILSPGVAMWMLPVSFTLMMITFVRVGRGRWFRTVLGAVGKGALLLLVTVLALIPASVLLLGVAAGGARFLP